MVKHTLEFDAVLFDMVSHLIPVPELGFAAMDQTGLCAFGGSSSLSSLLPTCTRTGRCSTRRRSSTPPGGRSPQSTGLTPRRSWPVSRPAKRPRVHTALAHADSQIVSQTPSQRLTAYRHT
jgi:hypothetical protein